RKGDGEGAARDGAPGIAGIDVLHALLRKEHADLEVGHHLRVAFRRDRDGVADVIVVTMRDQDVRHAGARLLYIAREFRIAAQERVVESDYGTLLQAESR